jgi:F-type H+-transporting ATPase subunit epsilon
MPDAFHFELVSPERLMFSGEVEAVIVPGTEGQFTVLKDHAPLMTRLKPGIVEVDETATKKSRLFVRGGFADVAPSGLTILAELAMPVEDFDAAAVAAQINDAEEDVADATSDEQKRLANEKLDQLRELKEALGI